MTTTELIDKMREADPELFHQIMQSAEFSNLLNEIVLKGHMVDNIDKLPLLTQIIPQGTDKDRQYLIMNTGHNIQSKGDLNTALVGVLAQHSVLIKKGGGYKKSKS